MEDNRKLAVAFGSFACVVEGYDNPFQIVQEVVQFFETQANTNPDFGDWASTADVDALKARLEASDSDATLDITTMPGGLRVRRLLAEPALAVVPADLDIEVNGLEAEDTPQESQPEPDVPAAYVTETVEEDSASAEADLAAELAMAFSGEPQTEPDVAQEDLPSETPSQDTEDMSVYEDTPVEASVQEGVDRADGIESSSEETDAAWAESAPEEVSIFAQDNSALDASSESELTRTSLESGIMDTDTNTDTGSYDPEPADDWALGDESSLMDEDDAQASDADDAPQISDTAALAAAVASADADDEDMLARLTEMLAPVDTPEPAPTPLREEAPEPNVEQAIDTAAETDVEPADVGDVQTPEPVATAEPEAEPATSIDDDIAASLRDADQVEFADKRPEPTDEPKEKAPPAPLRLGEADAPSLMRLTPEAAPMQLGEAAELPAGSAETPAAPASGGLFRRRSNEPADDQGATAASDTKPSALRLGAEAGPPPNREDQPSFIDAINTPDEPAPQPLVDLPDETEIAQDLSNALSGDADDETDTQSTARKGLRLGSLLKRKPDSDEPEAESAAAPRLVAEDREAEATGARKPGNLLRVVADRSNTAVDGDAPEIEVEKPAAAGGLRSFLRSKPSEEDVAETAPAAEDAPAPKATKASEEAARVKDRLHASYSDALEPAATASVELDETETEEDEDPMSPLGFARRASAKSLPDLMTAAAAYLNIVESRATVTRNDMVGVVQQISTDIPLTAEAKVKAVGKLVRSGTLVRLDGGMFMLDEVALQDYRDAMEGAA